MSLDEMAREVRVDRERERGRATLIFRALGPSQKLGTGWRPSQGDRGGAARGM